MHTCCTLNTNLIIVPEIKIPAWQELPPAYGCGLRNLGVAHLGNASQSRYMNNTANFGEFPWTAVIIHKKEVNGTMKMRLKCGGSLINPSVVLTAAQCVAGRNESTLEIRVGEWDVLTTNEHLGTQNRNVVKYIIHEEFSRKNLYNDIALLFLDKPVQETDHIKTICLPLSDNRLEDHERCFMSGWGKNVFGLQRKFQPIMKKVELSLVARNSCIKNLRQTKLGKYFELHKSFFCAGGESGKDSCIGDGGSPLVCQIPGTKRFYQAGIVSWGISCAAENIPGKFFGVFLFSSLNIY